MDRYTRIDLVGTGDILPSHKAIMVRSTSGSVWVNATTWDSGSDIWDGVSGGVSGDGITFGVSLAGESKIFPFTVKHLNDAHLNAEIYILN